MCFPPRPPQPLLPSLTPSPVWPGLVALAVGALYCRVDLAKPGVRGYFNNYSAMCECVQKAASRSGTVSSIATDERHNPITVSQSSI